VAGALAGRYEIERPLGRGGMATVYLARDAKHGRQVALKVLRPELAATLGSERFLREIQVSARLTHPHILALYDSGDSDGLLYYVMPYIEGESLRDRLSRETRLPMADAVKLGREVADALDYAHSRGVIHRDVKPENVLLGAGHAIVADFGIARAVHVAGIADVAAEGVIIGTPAYMSPEQANGQPLDGRSDLFAVGVVLWEMLIGQRLFAAEDTRATLAAVLFGKIPRPRFLRPDLPKDLEVILRHARRVATITQGLLSFARQSSGTQGPVELNRVVEEIVQLVQKDMGRSRVTVSTELGEGLPLITADANAVGQVLLNLLTNARRAMPDGGSITVETVLVDGGRSIRLAVRDSGPGIPPDILPKIFDPFFTTRSDGTGLGLSISHGIMEDHRGTIDVSSEVGRGTVFTLTFPVGAPAGS